MEGLRHFSKNRYTLYQFWQDREYCMVTKDYCVQSNFLCSEFYINDFSYNINLKILQAKMVERLILSGDNAAKHIQAYIDYHKY